MHDASHISSVEIYTGFCITKLERMIPMAATMAPLGATAIGRPAPLLLRPLAWHAAWLQKRRMHALDAHLRRDLGLPHAPAIRAAVRPGWDIGLSGLR